VVNAGVAVAGVVSVEVEKKTIFSTSLRDFELEKN
jgi:hypothetical protein